jgi:hypothetical protein
LKFKIVKTYAVLQENSKCWYISEWSEFWISDISINPPFWVFFGRQSFFFSLFPQHIKSKRLTWTLFEKRTKFQSFWTNPLSFWKKFHKNTMIKKLKEFKKRLETLKKINKFHRHLDSAVILMFRIF